MKHKHTTQTQTKVQTRLFRVSLNVSPGLMVEPVELDPPSVLGADPDGGGGQAVVLPSHHQGGEDGGAVGPPAAPLGNVGGALLAEGGEVSLHHRLDAVHRLHLWLLVDAAVGEGGLQQVVVEAAVGHGAVEAADGPDAHGEGFGLQGAPRVDEDLWLQRRRRRRRRGRRTETLRLGLVETPPLLPS